jgi:FkbM family methyltransferase
MKWAARLLFATARRTPEFRGKHKVLRHLVSKLPIVDEFRIQSGGANFSIRGVEINEFWMAVQGVHSPEIFNKICELVGDDNATVWDIGANIGTTSLPLLATKRNVNVVAFEPSPDVCGKLLKNARLNPNLTQRLTVLNCALSDRSSWVEFFTSNEIANSGVGGIGNAENRSKVSFMTFAQLGSSCAALVTEPDIIKIDVEGHELSVLRGLGAILDRSPLTIIFEHSVYRLKELGASLSEVPEFLEGRGFNISTLDRVGPVDLGIDQDLVASK